jgi:hypothetical protein
MNTRATTKLLGAALAVTGLLAMSTAAHADIKCRRTVAKQSAKATQGIAKIIQKCQQAVLDGKQSGPCPDTKGAASITKTESKLTAAIEKDCATSTGEFAFGHCPNETGFTGNCGNILIKSKTDEGTCLGCLAEHNAKELFNVVYGHAIAPADDTIAKCQSTTGKEVLGFYKAKSKALAKCRDAVLKGKIPGPCPDADATAAIDKAESKKVAKIAGACCGDDSTLVCSAGPNIGATCTVDSQCPESVCSSCGGAKCAANIPPVICNGGTRDLQPCTPSCAGGANAGTACTVDSQCPGSTCTGSGDAQCPGGTCVSTAAGDACEAPVDCGRCRDGTTAGSPCKGSGQCQSDPGACNPQTLVCVGGPDNQHAGDPPKACTLECIGGTNNYASCLASSECPGGSCKTALHCIGGTNATSVCQVASECPGGTCQIDCRSTAAGTCVGTTGFCGGSDDVNPLTQFGLPAPCPGITLGGSAITLTGVTGATLLTCLDTQADQRVQCQDAAGATFAQPLPSFCADRVSECATSGSTVTVTVAVNSATSLGGVTVNLGYQNALLPGVGDIGGRAVSLDGSASIASSDNDDSVVTSVVDFGGLPNGNLFTIQFDTCSGGPAPTTADFGCVVSSASDTTGVTLLDGVTCSVASIM